MKEKETEEEIHDHDECPYCKARVRDLSKHKEIQHEGINIKTFLKDSKWTILTAVIIIPGLIINFFFTSLTLVNISLYKILLGLGIVIGGYPLAREGFEELIKEKKFDVDFLVVIAALGAIYIQYWGEAGVLILLFNTSETLEDYSVFKARGTIKELMDLSPDTARVRRGIKQKEIPVKEVKEEDIVVVRPGERVPLDGKITKGKTSIDESPVTGESMPVEKEEGDKVFAGTLNKEGLIELEVKGPGSSTLSKIINLVEEASQKKSPTEKLVNKISRYYTPIILGLSILITVIPVIGYGRSFQPWFYRSLVLLVLSCPCAFVISTPVSMVSAISASAKKGVLIKGGKYIEQIQKIDTFFFDKTGTLTKGEPEVTDLITIQTTEEDLISKATALEESSNHPLAQAIKKEWEIRDLEGQNASSIESVAGFGLKGKINGELFKLGSPDFFDDEVSDLEEIHRLQEQEKTCVVLGNQESILGIIGIRDEIRPEAKDFIKSLREKGKRTVMLTGDNEGTAKAIAQELGIDEYKSELLPEDKINYIEEEEQKRRVSMVGDGINDAPALARATIGIAMGAAGTDTAIEASDISLMKNDLTKILYLIENSEKTNKIIKQNVTTSIGIKGVMAALTFPGIVTLWMAVGFGDAGMALLVTLNSLRILRT